MTRRCYAIILPVRNEQEALGRVLAELQLHLSTLSERADFTICVGLNACTDRSIHVARAAGVEIAETPLAGYGHGCRAAIQHLEETGLLADAYIFMAADGANDPRDLGRLLDAHDDGIPFVLGCRTDGFRNVRGAMSLSHLLANWTLGAWVGVLTGRWYHDLGPFRLLERSTYHRLHLNELTYGWTIEAQVLAARIGVPSREVSVRERARLAGKQKVSGVSLAQTLRIGAQIFAAGWRSRRCEVPAVRVVSAPSEV